MTIEPMDDVETIGDVMREARVMAYLESCALRSGLEIPPVVEPCVKSVVMPISCPTCGSCMEFVTNSAPAKMRVTAMFLCATCEHSWQFVGGLQSAFTTQGVPKPRTKVEDIRCGTESGYRLHLRLGQDTCDLCRQAHADENAGRRRAVRA